MKPSLYVDLDAVRHNLKAWRHYVDERPVWAVVKCDAYRMGMAQVARACLQAGAQRLCVVEMHEAEQLRQDGIDAPIVQVAATPEEDIDTGVRCGVVMSVADLQRARKIAESARRQSRRATIHVAIETGTGWWGVAPADMPAFAREAAALSGIDWEGAWTHIAGRDSMGAQYEKFRAGVEALRKAGIAVPKIHIGSSGPSVWGLREGAVRVGVGLYGAAMGDAQQAAQLRTALEVRAPVYGVRRFSEPMPLGYGGTYVALPGQTIVTLRIGYGEGMPKALAGRGSVLLVDTLCPIVGAIGMNFTMVAIPPNVEPDPQGFAIIVGDQPGVKLEDVAAAAQTIPHNIVTTLGAGLQPVYHDAPLPAAER